MEDMEVKNMGNLVLIELHGNPSSNWRRNRIPSFIIPRRLVVIKNHFRVGSADDEIISTLAQSKGK
jgi:hypothetical protein